MVADGASALIRKRCMQKMKNDVQQPEKAILANQNARFGNRITKFNRKINDDYYVSTFVLEKNY